MKLSSPISCGKKQLRSYPTPWRGIQRTYGTAMVQSLGPLQRLIRVHDAALEAVAARDTQRLGRALAILRRALDYAVDPVFALGLDRLYRHCQLALAEGNHDEAGRILWTLRAAWQKFAERLPDAS